MQACLSATENSYRRLRRRLVTMVVLALWIEMNCSASRAAEAETPDSLHVGDAAPDLDDSWVETSHPITIEMTDYWDDAFERSGWDDWTSTQLRQPHSVRMPAAFVDEQIEPIQATQPSIGPPATQPPLGSTLGDSPQRRAAAPNRQQRTASRAGVSLGIASVPFMIGDTGAGTCFSLRGIVTVDVAHPTLTCSRLNVSENNTAVPVDRFYYSYRHFHNSTGVQAFQYKESFDLDRHTLGLERTFWDEMASIEVRAPILYRLRSDLLSLIAPPDGVVDVVTGSDDREAGIGNLAFISKLLLMERQTFALTTGLGVTVPTARDVQYDIGVRDTIIFPIAPGVTGDTLSSFENDFKNETVYLSPFLAWLWAPESRWYHQGFLQVEVAANPSTLITDGGGVTDFFFNGGPIGDVVFRTPGGLPTETDIFAQTLLRVNLGVGYRITDLDRRRWISNLNALFELHYTSTLQRANVSTIAIEELGTGAFFPQFATAGNADPRTDILNAAAGLSCNVGPFVVTNGVAAPIRTGSDRGFDFEYNLQVQLPY